VLGAAAAAAARAAFSSKYAFNREVAERYSRVGMASFSGSNSLFSSSSSMSSSSSSSSDSSFFF